jgi:hypothetical protein
MAGGHLGRQVRPLIRTATGASSITAEPPYGRGDRFGPAA